MARNVRYLIWHFLVILLMFHSLARGPHVAVVGLLLDVALAEAPPPHQVGHVANIGSVLQIYDQSSHLKQDNVSECYLVYPTLGRKLHPLLLLALVTEPDPHHVLLEVELLGDGGDLLPAGPGLDGEVSLQGSLLRRRY